MSIVCGPVIGKTTCSSTRVLLEVDADCRVSCILSAAEGNGADDEAKDDQVVVEADLKAFEPFAFAVDGLAEGTKYLVSFKGAGKKADDENPRTGSVRTYSKTMKEFRVVAASCDKTLRRGDVNMFDKVYDEFIDTDKVHLMVRHGDQVYADQSFKQAVKHAKDKKKSREEQDEAIKKTYRDWYMSTWNAKDAARVMANCPQLMLWDDHEIRNDWGTFKQDVDRKHVDYRCAKIGRQLYWRYQRQLWDDVAPLIEADEKEESTNNYSKPDGPKTEGHMHTFCDGRFGVLFVDSRASRSFSVHADDVGKKPQSFIGKWQWEILRDALGDGGDAYFAKTQALLVVHSMPAVYLSTGASSCLSIIGPLRDKMGMALNPEEQGEYLQLLESWSTRVENRKLLLVAGDMHYGMQTEVYKRDSKNGKKQPVFKQLLTSAISNNMPPRISYCLQSYCCSCFCCTGIGNGAYDIKVTRRLYARNVGEIIMRARDDGQAEIVDRIVGASD
eukprot:TRINITY_DN60111_c0_g2_i1.p1 TRINITY_DN60111_c0_g2~~TRINITY_DN60111_c0_g2_i1.p1  ORF type:complete len:501 (+),score=268.87 TRINITY_DN60111_c0_g2_i1:49-1551(+)